MPQNESSRFMSENAKPRIASGTKFRSEHGFTAIKFDIDPLPSRRDLHNGCISARDHAHTGLYGAQRDRLIAIVGFCRHLVLSLRKRNRVSTISGRILLFKQGLVKMYGLAYRRRDAPSDQPDQAPVKEVQGNQNQEGEN